MMKMNEETQNVYAKYGVSPMGTCLPMLIQLPILFALYRVIWNIPAYVASVKDVFTPLVNVLLKTQGTQQFLADTVGTRSISRDLVIQQTVRSMHCTSSNRQTGLQWQRSFRICQV